MYRITFVCCLLILIASTQTAHASDKLPLFKDGERIDYKLYHLRLIPIAVGSLTTNRIYPEGESDHIYQTDLTIKSNGPLSLVYRVNDVSHSIFNATKWQEVEHSISIEEGNYRKRKKSFFDRKSMSVKYIENDKDPLIFNIEKDTQGLITLLMIARNEREALMKNKEIHFSLFDSKKLYKMKASYKRNERIEVGPGYVDTVMVETRLVTDGVFRSDGELLLWFSDDKLFAPMMIGVGTTIGTVYAIMSNYTNIDLNIIPRRQSFQE